MISLEDCIAMCGLNAEQVAAIAEHEHIPDMLAAAMADQLLHQVGGVERIAEIMLDDIDSARRSGHTDQADKLDDVLADFLQQHAVGADVPRRRRRCGSGPGRARQQGTPLRPARAA